MKFILNIFFSFIFAATASAGDAKSKITIGSNAKTSTLEIKFNSTHKKNFPANVAIINAEGKQVILFKCEIEKGLNVVSLHDALNLKEGIYTVEMTVKKRKSSTKFVLFNRLDTNS